MGLADGISTATRIPTHAGGVDREEKVKLTKLLRANGFVDTRTWKAIVLAESGGDPKRVNTSAPCSRNGDRAIGLMQICTVNGSMLRVLGAPQERAKLEEWLKDPTNNVRAGFLIHKAQGKGAWEVWTKGTYRQFLNAPDPDIVVNPSNAAINPGDAGSFIDAVNPLKGIDLLASAVSDISKLFSQLFSSATWLRIGKVYLGLVIATIALWKLSGISVSDVAGVATKNPAAAVATKAAATTKG